MGGAGHRWPVGGASNGPPGRPDRGLAITPLAIDLARCRKVSAAPPGDPAPDGASHWPGSAPWIWVRRSGPGKVFTNTSADIADTDEDVIYHSEYSTATGQIDLDVPVDDGTYELRLYFAEIYWGAPGGGAGGPGSRVFDVVVEGALELDDYDIAADVGSATAVVKTFTVVVTDGNIDVELISEVNQAKLSAFEIVPQQP